MNIRQLLDAVMAHRVRDDLDVLVRMNREVHDVTSVELVNVEGDPYFLALDCTEATGVSEGYDQEEDRETTG